MRTAKFARSVNNKRVAFAVRTDDGAVLSSVSVLLDLWNPAAICRFVMPIIVAAVDRQIVGVPVGFGPIAERLKPLPFGT